MPRMAAHVYAAHQANLLKLASRKGGVSRAQAMDELNISRTVADKIIKEAELEVVRKEGRTEFFGSKNGSAAPVADVASTDAPKATLSPEVKDVAVVENEDEVHEVSLDTLAHLDEEIVDTRNALKEAAAKAGKALGEWATHQALVDALRDRMTKLAAQRMDACS